MERSQKSSKREKKTGDPLFTSSIVSIRRFDFTLLVSFFFRCNFPFKHRVLAQHLLTAKPSSVLISDLDLILNVVVALSLYDHLR